MPITNKKVVDGRINESKLQNFKNNKILSMYDKYDKINTDNILTNFNSGNDRDINKNKNMILTDKYLFTLSNEYGNLEKWDYTTGEFIKKYKAVHYNRIIASKNGKFIYGLTNKCDFMKINVETDKEDKIVHHKGYVSLFNVSSDDKLLFANNNGTNINIFDIETGLLIRSFNFYNFIQHSNDEIKFYDVKMSKDNKYIIASIHNELLNDTLLYGDITTGKMFSFSPNSGGPIHIFDDDNIICVKYLICDGLYLSIVDRSNGDCIKLFDKVKLSSKCFNKPNTTNFRHYVVSDDNKFLFVVGCDEKTVYKLDIETGNILNKVNMNGDFVIKNLYLSNNDSLLYVLKHKDGVEPCGISTNIDIISSDNLSVVDTIQYMSASRYYSNFVVSSNSDEWIIINDSCRYGLIKHSIVDKRAKQVIDESGYEDVSEVSDIETLNDNVKESNNTLFEKHEKLIKEFNKLNSIIQSFQEKFN